MSGQDVLQELQTLGTVQNQKIYRRNGVKGDLYGVSYTDLNKLKKRIKVDHELARELWASGNHDARVLATMISDPKQVDESLLDSWVQDLDSYPISDAFSNLAARSPLTRQKMEEWTPSEEEWIGYVGWNLLGSLAQNDPALPDAFFDPYLIIIERDIHGRKNRVRHAMNGVVIAVGMRNDALEQKASSTAERIGKVEVDHGQTSCKTPDAISYIRKARQRKAR
ncbi:MAG: DNA alkylation repair protein [Ardenticatenaceae bacterium]